MVAVGSIGKTETCHIPGEEVLRRQRKQRTCDAQKKRIEWAELKEQKSGYEEAPSELP